jgi:hypothetical protein
VDKQHLDQLQAVLSSSLEKFKNVVNKDVNFILANIVTEDKSNEFSFRLHLKHENVGSGQGQKEIHSFMELEAKAKVPTAQGWSLKIMTEPPVLLVSEGKFLSDFPAVKIPKEIVDRTFVDYELQVVQHCPVDSESLQQESSETSSGPSSHSGFDSTARLAERLAELDDFEVMEPFDFEGKTPIKKDSDYLMVRRMRMCDHAGTGEMDVLPAFSGSFIWTRQLRSLLEQKPS